MKRWMKFFKSLSGGILILTLVFVGTFFAIDFSKVKAADGQL